MLRAVFPGGPGFNCLYIESSAGLVDCSYRLHLSVMARAVHARKLEIPVPDEQDRERSDLAGEQ